MCGIAGILSTQLSLETVNKRVLAMQQELHHRGPDDSGLYTSNSQPVSLAHTRLSILDLSAAGRQPMATADERYWIVFNGEIYNFQTLRAELVADGDHFLTHTDTEVILHLFQRYGKNCLNHLRGMFAFAIWDSAENSCFIARDPLGIKPLYYAQIGSQLIFSSEVRSLLASGLVSKQLSPEGLYGYFINGSVPEPYTLLKDIRCLPAGSWLQWQKGNLTQQHYWQIQFSAENISESDAITRTHTALIESVKAHYTSDVPVGIFLSGGIDSTAIVALSRQVYQGKLRTYSIALEDPEMNEGDLAKRVADRFGTEHVEHILTATEAKQLFPQFLEAIDQPSIDGFNSFCISKVAHAHGQKVVLSGLGGDEMFAGYKSFEKLPQMMRWGQFAKRVQPITNRTTSYLRRPSCSGKLQRMGDYLSQPASLAGAYRSFRGIFSHFEAITLTAQFLPDAEPPSLLDLSIQSQQSNIADQISELELSNYMRNQLLRDSDVMSMSWGLELRVPFVDSQLLDTVASIPSTQRLACGKQLLIDAVPEVPEWIVNRPKRGFRFPFDRWFADEWSAIGSDNFCPSEIALTPWYRKWSIVVLQYWLQEVLS